MEIVEEEEDTRPLEVKSGSPSLTVPVTLERPGDTMVAAHAVQEKGTWPSQLSPSVPPWTRAGQGPSERTLSPQ